MPFVVRTVGGPYSALGLSCIYHHSSDLYYICGGNHGCDRLRSPGREDSQMDYTTMESSIAWLVEVVEILQAGMVEGLDV